MLKIFLVIVGVIILIGLALMFFICCGENGYDHDCIHANTCPGSIRCSDEKNMKCFEPGLKQRQKEIRKERFWQVVGGAILLTAFVYILEGILIWLGVIG